MKLEHLYALAERLKTFTYITRARRVEDNVIELAIKGESSGFRVQGSEVGIQGDNHFRHSGPDPESRGSSFLIPHSSLFLDMTRGHSMVYIAPSQRPLQGYNAPFDTLLHTLISSARILRAYVVDDDRILRIDLAPKSSYKNQQISLQFEFTGKNTNAILLDENDIIIEALRHIDGDSSFRVIRPGVELVPLPPRIRDDGETACVASFPSDRFGSNSTNDKKLSLASRISHAEPDPKSHQAAEGILNQVQDDEPATHSSPIDTILIENHRKRHTRKLAQSKQTKASATRKQIKKFDQLLRKLSNPEKLLLDAGKYQNTANVVLANLHNISPYSKQLETKDFEGNDILIDLPANIHVNRVGEYFFNLSKRAKNKAKNIHIEQENLESKKEFYVNILHAIENAQSLRELELLVPKRGRSQRKKERLKEGELFWIDDFKVFVGRNSTENQHLLKIARANDIWMHVRDIPSSHVIIRTDKQNLPDSVIEAAAKLCVDFSIRQPGDYEVDYTKRKFVKIQEGSRVEYDKYQTVRVRKEGVEIRE